MKEIRLLSLELENFKGIRDFILEPRGKDIFVYGRNKTGKTTLFDAFLWLLFDKDSKGQSQFDIKTKKPGSNEPMHGLDHRVKGTFEIDGSQLTLEKVYKEKWTKKRGSADKKFTGHTTDYFISGVPVKKKEYDEKISEIVDEDIFRLLTDPRHFNEQLHWAERREILLEVCGDVSDEDVIGANDQLEKLASILGERDIEEHRKVIKSKQKDINKELEKLPVRIDEVNQGLPDVAGLDWKELQAGIDDLKVAKTQKEEELSQLQNGGGVSEKRKELAEIETELENIKREHRAGVDEELNSKRKELNEVRDRINSIKSDVRMKSREKDQLRNKAGRLGDKIQNLRDKWHRENDKEFDEGKFDTVQCPDCGSKFHLEDVEEKRAEFNAEKAEKLEEINTRGKQLKEELEQTKAEISELEAEIDKLESELEAAEKEKADLESNIEDLNEKAAQYQDSTKYKAKLEEKKQIKSEIEQLKQDKREQVSEVKQEIANYESDIEKLQGEIQKIKQYNQGQKRIKELKEKEEELAAEYEKLEEELYLTEEFTRTKVGLLEDKINSHFDYTTFKLFEKQVNGGIKETCEALDDGVSYNSTLNTGSKFKIGIDIINTLSEHYGIQAPIFIDGRESITEPLQTDSQLISLVVSESDDELRVVGADKEMKEAV